MAAQWVAAPGDPGVIDDRVWESLLTRLYGIDLRHSAAGGYLVGDDEVREWLDDLRRQRASYGL